MFASAIAIIRCAVIEQVLLFKIKHCSSSESNWNAAVPLEAMPVWRESNIEMISLVSQVDVMSLSKKTSWPERRVQVWFRRRRNQYRPGLQKRFCEARCVCVGG